MNIPASSIDFFLADFEQYAENTAIIWKDNNVSYTAILQRINYWRDKLNEIQAQQIVCLEGDFSPETIALLYVLIEKNVVVVPLDIHQGKKNITKYDIAQVDMIIRVHDEQVTITERQTDGEKNKLYQEIFACEAPGLVLFTSGSSGKPKGAVHDFSKLLNKFRTKRKALKTINFLLFDHWGGLNTLFHIMSNGGTVVILENRNPDYVAGLIEKYKVELLPTSPTFLNMLLLSRAYEGKDFSSLKVISYGAEPMPENLLVRLNRVFPEIRLQQTYGLIELGVMRSKSESNESLWVKIGGEGFETRVVDGMLQVKADSNMLGYLNAPSPFTEDGWFMTGDSVEEKDGYYRILGRKSELINVGGEKVFPQEVENVILEIPEISDAIVYGENNSITGKIVCAKVSYKGNEPKSEIIKKIKTFCRTRLQTFKVPVKITVVDETFENDRFKKNRVGSVTGN
jgi:acyl-coenzyme A synthetase/AMP-(fatty) acid ligase